MDKPNLFKFATSELSQDAVICWLLSWAKPEYQVSDKKLHECAQELLRVLFETCGVAFPAVIKSVEINKQDSRIDVVCVVNEACVLVIEDKTNTSQHSGQLERYAEIVHGRDFHQENILLIYFKTGDQSDYSSVEKAGYVPFLRKDLLAVLNKYESIQSDIFQNYRGVLNDLEASVQSFRTLPLDRWTWHSWIGFYSEMQKHFPDGRWDYVANPSGGFLGFWFSSSRPAYLQMEQEGFCFKIDAVDVVEKRVERAKWHEKIMEAGCAAGLKLRKPNRFGLGLYMTVCVLDEEYRQVKEGILDVPATVEFVQKLVECVKTISPERFLSGAQCPSVPVIL